MTKHDTAIWYDTIRGNENENSRLTVKDKNGKLGAWWRDFLALSLSLFAFAGQFQLLQANVLYCYCQYNLHEWSSRNSAVSFSWRRCHFEVYLACRMRLNMPTTGTTVHIVMLIIRYFWRLLRPSAGTHTHLHPVELSASVCLCFESTHVIKSVLYCTWASFA